MRLTGKTALVTGASSGIGWALALQFAREGAKLIVTARNRTALEEIVATTPGATAVEADLTDTASLGRFCDRVYSHGASIDILVHNAGVGIYAKACDTDPEQARRLISLNLLAAVELTRRLLPLVPDGGSVAFVSSLAGKVAIPNMSVYSASKHALNAFADVLRMESMNRNIHVLAVCPGIVSTGFSKRMLQGNSPLWLSKSGRKGISPERCARAILSGILQRKRTVVVPWTGWALVAAKSVLPRAVDIILARYGRARGEG